MEKKKIAEKASYRQEAIEDCGFCNRTCWALRRGNVNDVFSLIHMYNKGEIGQLRGIGEKGYAEIEKYVSERF